jgi:methylase of polypeptide subunit release factors
LESNLVAFVGEQKLTIDNPIVLVANLPYIPDETFDANADQTVKAWEPRMAFV